MSAKYSTREYDPLSFHFCTADDPNALINTQPQCSVYPILDIAVNNISAPGSDLNLATFSRPEQPDCCREVLTGLADDKVPLPDVLARFAHARRTNEYCAEGSH